MSSEGKSNCRQSITEQIRFRASQLMPQLLKSFQPSKAFDLGLARYLVKPIQYRDAPVFILKENDPRFRHPYLNSSFASLTGYQPYLIYRKIAKNSQAPVPDRRFMIKAAITHREEPSDRIAVVEYVPSIFASVSRSRNASGKRDNPDNKPG